MAINRLDTIPAAGFGHAANAILRDGAGHYLVAATLANGYGAIADVGAALLDSGGTVLAERRCNRGGAEVLNGAVSDGKGGYYLYGITSGIDNPGCPQAWTISPGFNYQTENPCTQVGVTFVYRVFAIKLDANLDTVWIRTLDTAGFGGLSGFADSKGGLRLLYGSASRDSMCLTTFDPQGSQVSTHCLAPTKDGVFMGTSLAGDRLMLGGNTYDRVSGAPTTWMISCDSAGKPDWSYQGNELSRAYPLFMYPSGDAIISYWRLPGFGALLEGRVRNGTFSITRIREPAQLYPATPRFPTPGGLILYGPYREGISSGLTANLALDSAGRIDSSRAPRSQYQLSCFPDSAHLWASIDDGGTATESLRIARLRLDAPPRFTDASRAYPWRFLEGDTVNAVIAATDDYLPQGLHLKLLGSTDTARFNPVTGAFHWAPPTDWHGDSTFRFVATDTLGLADTLTAAISFANVNDPVVIKNNLFYPGYLLQDEPKPKRIPAYDADLEPLRYVLLAGPPGLSLGDSGVIDWGPSPAPGFYPLAARVFDSVSYAQAAYSLWAMDSLPRSFTPIVASQATYQSGMDLGTAVFARSIGAQDSIRVSISVSSDYAYPPTYGIKVFSWQTRDSAAELELTFYCGFANAGTEVRVNGTPVSAQFLPQGPAVRFLGLAGDSVEIRTYYGQSGASTKRQEAFVAPAGNRVRYDVLGRLRRGKLPKPGTFAAPALRPPVRN